MAPTVSVSFFIWSRPPGGNAYFSVFPTTLIPLGDASPMRDAEVGRRFAFEVISGDHGPVSLAQYSADEILVPWVRGGEVTVWPPPTTGRGLPRLPRGLKTRLDRRERLALRTIVATFDLAWHRRGGRPDAATTTAVLNWLDEIVEALEADADARLAMPFDETTEPCDVLRVRIVGHRGSIDVACRCH